jgi:hypothetical protein
MGSVDDFKQYVLQNSKRGVCSCGQCGRPTPDVPQDTRCTLYNGFFNVTKLGSANRQRFAQLFVALGIYPVNVQVGKEVTYRHLGAVIGDMDVALQAMALGDLLGVWKLNTPWRAFKTFAEQERRELAKRGLVSVIL